MSTKTIIFYDTSRLGDNNPENTVSPWTVVTQWSLKIKGLPYERKLYDVADVASVCEAVGFKPTNGPLGCVMPTFPAIDDPNTNSKISDTFDIAEYLDKTYSGAGQPRLIPQGTRGLQKAFVAAMMATEAPLYQFVLPIVAERITGKDKEYFVRTREGAFGTSLENIKPQGDRAVTEWAKVKAAFDTFDSWFEEGTVFLTGNSPILADLYLAGRIFWMRVIFGPESKEWKEIELWNGGRWARLFNSLQQQYPLDRK